MSRFDVVVIGGGPAGMMAAARAAQYGARVALVEKNKELGMKLMITGRGRCNFAHDEEDPEALAKDYRNGGEFLLPSLKKFGTKETTAFFLRRGVVAVPERGRRLYPRDGQDASTVVNAMWTALKDGGVQVLRSIEVRSLDLLGGKARRLITTKQEIEGSAFIIATGGLSFPNTGSTGDGYRFARKAGHDIAEPAPALCPVKIQEKVDDYLDGLKLKNVRVTLSKDGEQVDERFGEMDFTHFGISGAIIMDMASSVDEALKSSANVKIHIDLKPALEPERLDARIDRDFEEFKTDALRFAVRKMLPGQIIPSVLDHAGLDLGKPCGETTPDERQALRDAMKDYAVTPTGLLGFRHAIITKGGVKTDGIDPETMRSKHIPNLYFAGEVLDVDGPTGGYNLQACWTTGYAAGSAAAEALGFKAPTDQQIVQQMFEAQTRRDDAERARKLEEKRVAEEAAAAEGVTAAAGIVTGSGIDDITPEDDMTIKTGPTDDKEFCGWKDPRKDGTAPEGAGRDSERDNGRRNSDRGYALRDGDRPRRRREDGGYRSRDGRTGKRDDRPRDESRGRDGYRSRDDRPYRERDDRRDGSERRSYGPREDGDRPYRSRDEYRRNDGDRPYRRAREDGEYRGRDDRGYGERYDRPRDERRGRDGYRSREDSRSYEERTYRSREEEGRRYTSRDERGDFRPRRSDDRPYGSRDEYRRSGDDRPYRRDDRDGYRDRDSYRRSDDRPYRDRDEGGRPYRRREDGDSYRSRENRDGYRAERSYSGSDHPYRDRDDRRGSDRPHGSRNGYKGKAGKDDRYAGKAPRHDRGSKPAGAKDDAARQAAKPSPAKTAEDRPAEEAPRRRRFTNFEQFRRK